MTAPQYAKTYLRTTETSSSFGWIDEGDIIYALASSGNMTQVLYPKSDGKYRCAWVFSSDIVKKYTISFNANGGAGAPGNQTKTSGENLTLSLTVPTRTGYSFLGWSTNADATSAQYGAGGVYATDADATLYAVWKTNQYNVSFDANGGTGAPSPQTKTHGTALTLSSAKPTRAGYSFFGWATTSTATSAAYSAGGAYNENTSVVLYAVWKANTYSVTYDANGGTGTMQNSNHVFDKKTALNANAFVRDGYEFAGWSTNAVDENYMYADKESVVNLSITNGEVIKLYAIWKQVTPTHIPGDINEDNAVNNKDLTRLMKYLAGEDVVVNQDALDVNGDGSINNKDLTRLMKYLAGEDVVIN